jgi:AcrR family transcriptional regulator
MTSARRIGAPDAKNRGLLLDAAEQLMLEGGYTAVTSRRLASKAGLKPQLVHYYFRTMEELFLAVFRRRAEEGLQVQAQALASPQPLWALWRFGTDPALHRYGVATEEMPPLVWTVLMTSLSRFLVLEQALGMSGGHAETLQLVEGYLRRLEGEPQPITGMPPTWVVHQ